MGLTSIVMVSYHTGKVLRHALRFALAQEGLAELILVDNGNTEETLAELHALAEAEPRFTLITGHGNIGFAAGCNRGAALATGDYLLLLNPDCLLPPRALLMLSQALETHPRAMLAGPLLLNPDGTEQRGGRRALLSPESALGEVLRLPGRRLNRYKAEPPQAVEEVPAISGACMCIRRADYRALGSMDEAYFLHLEDLDFCLRVAKAGGVTICVPQARVVHWRSTSHISSRVIERHKRDGFLRYFRTHYGLCKTPWSLSALGIQARYHLKILAGALRRPAEDIYGRQLLRLLDVAIEPAVTDQLQGKHVLVTGATSQIGVFALGRLLAAGAIAHALTREARHVQAPQGVEWLTGDLARLPALPPCDASIHCAPIWALPQALPRLAEAGIGRIVAFSSTSALTKKDSADAHERQVAASLNESEALCRKRCAELGITLTLLRPTLIYGLGMDKNVSRLARMIRRFGVVPVYPPATGLRQPVHADDLAIAALKALASDAASGREYNVSGGETLSFRAMVTRVAEVLGRRAIILPVTFLPALLDAIGRILHNSFINGAMARRMNQDLVFSHDDAACDFGYAPRAFLSGGKDDL